MNSNPKYAIDLGCGCGAGRGTIYLKENNIQSENNLYIYIMQEKLRIISSLVKEIFMTFSSGLMKMIE